WVPIGSADLCPDTLPMFIGAARHRGKGYGTRALRLLVGRARQLGWKKLRTKGVYAYNERSRRMFIQAGFAVVQSGGEREGEPDWIFELDLSVCAKEALLQE